jgi:hypothetical protein
MSVRRVTGAAGRAWSLVLVLWMSVAAAIGPLPPTPIALGSTSSALSLRSQIDFVQVPDALPLHVSSNLTVEAWV